MRAVGSSLPTLHIRPTRGWLNDPNGMTRHRGRWHVFFQHNPLRARHAAIQWGHVSTGDLVSWTEHPVAFGPHPGGPDSGGCWSGSFLPWGERPSVAYTGIVDGPERSTVCVRYALDEDLETWSDPVVVAREPEGAGIRAMRDPYPFLWGGRRFALLGAGMTDGTPSVLLFSCDDPHAWRFEGAWLTGHDDVAAAAAPADIWECPQLVRFGNAYVLVLSLQTAGRLDDVVYLVGSVTGDATTGHVPRFAVSSGDTLDHGPDFYAPQVIDDGGESPLLFGWIRQEDAPDDAPDDAVAGCLTLPRRLRLESRRIHVVPDPALEALLVRGTVVRHGPRNLQGAEQQPRSVPLPSRARVTVGPAGDPFARVSLQGLGAPVPLHEDGLACDIWLDGEVAEIYRPDAIAATIRRPGTSSWSLTGNLVRCVITVKELALPRQAVAAVPQSINAPTHPPEVAVTEHSSAHPSGGGDVGLRDELVVRE